MRDAHGRTVHAIERRTARLLLRDLTHDDVTQRYVEWMNDERINKYLESRFETHTIESVRDAVVQLSQDSVFAAIIEQATGQHIGNIKLGPVHHCHNTADIGLLIGEERCWGRGLATEAITAITLHGFEDLGLAKITASAYADNAGSIRAFQRAGFEIEGTRRSQYRIGTHRTDAILLGLIRHTLTPAFQRDPSATVDS